MPHELFFQIALIMTVAGAISLLIFRLRQPLVIAYLLTGIILGPSVLGLMSSVDVFSTLSTMGVSLLLFIVGLGLNWRNVRDVGGAAVMAGFGQTLLTSLLGFGIALIVHFDLWTSVFIGIAFSFSSTILIVKMLSDKEDLERLYGRIAVGALITQDILAMFLLLFVSGYRGGGDLGALGLIVFIKGFFVLCGLGLLSKYLVPRLFSYAAQSSELLFLLALSWCFAVAAVLHALGFGTEIGALLAGVTLAGSGFQHEIGAKVKVLRDFFLVIFFIVLGNHLGFQGIRELLVPAVAFSLFVLVGNPLIMLLVMRAMGHHPRTGFLAGTTMAQISEFSFILLTSGMAAGLVVPSALVLATIVAIITIAASSYLISYNEQLFDYLSRQFTWLGKAREMLPVKEQHVVSPDIVLLGCDRLGREILPQIRVLTANSVVIDVNPSVIESLRAEGVSVFYGDAGAEEVLRAAHALFAKMVISTIPDMQINADIIDALKASQAKAIVILTAKSPQDADRCYALGAHFVIVPSILGGAHFAEILRKKKVAKTAWRSHRKMPKVGSYM